MTNLLTCFVKAIKEAFGQSSWKEAMEVMRVGAKYNEDMLVAVYDMKRRQDEAIELGNAAVRRHNELLKLVVEMTEAQNLTLMKSGRLIQRNRRTLQ